jgi:hypothetical protein
MMADRMTLESSTRPTASPIARVLNEELRHYHRPKCRGGSLAS